MALNRYDLLKKEEITSEDVNNYLTLTIDLHIAPLIFPPPYDLKPRLSALLDTGFDLEGTTFKLPYEYTLLQKIFVHELAAALSETSLDIASTSAPKDIFLCLEKFLADHWRIIQNSPELQYQYRPTFYFNRVCMDIALLCAKGLNKTCGEVLYPTLKDCSSPVALTPLVDASRVPALPLVCTNFVLSDCGEYSIELDYCFESALSDGVLRHTQKPNFPPLSESERERVISHNRFAKKLYAAMMEWKHFNSETPNVGACIIALIKGLRDGGANRETFTFLSGKDDSAGKQANDAITEFTEHLKLLSAEKLAALHAMRSKDFTFATLIEQLTNQKHQHKLQAFLDVLMKNERTAEYIHCQRALERNANKEPELKNELLNALERAKLLLSTEESALIKKYDELKSTPGKCVETQANDWRYFLQANEESLYSMTLTSSPDVKARISSLKLRLHEYLNDLQHYLALLDEYLVKKSTSIGKLPKHLRYFKADCLSKPDESMCAEFIAQWLISSPDQTVLIKRLDTLTAMTEKHPRKLFEIDLFKRLPESILSLMVKEFGFRFSIPVLQYFKDHGCILDDERCISELWTFCREKKVLTNIVRVLLVMPDGNMFANDNGYSPLLTAVSTGLDEVTKLLIDKGAATRETEYSMHVISKAFEQNNIDRVKLLLPTVDKADASLLKLACQSNSVTIYQLTYDRYLELGCDAIELIELMYHLAFNYSNFLLLEYAVNHGARRNINDPFASGDTALTLCLTKGKSNESTLRAIQALVRAGANVDYVHPNMNVSVLTLAIYSYWLHCITTKCQTNHPEEDKLTCHSKLEHELLHGKLVLAALLTDKLPTAIIATEVMRHPVQWIIDNISTDMFLLSIINSPECRPTILENLFYVADLLTNAQLKCLMQHHEKELLIHFVRVLPQQYQEIIMENDWDSLLRKLMINDPTPLQYCVIFLLMHHPKLSMSHEALLKHAIEHRLLPVVARLAFTASDMTFARLNFINNYYTSGIAILFCQQLDAMRAVIEPKEYSSLQQQLINMCFEHDDTALMSCIMASSAGRNWREFRYEHTGFSLLMVAVKSGSPDLYRALLQSQCALDAVNKKDNCTVYDYVCEKLITTHIRVCAKAVYDPARLLPFFEMVLHFPLDRSLASSVMDVIKNLKANPPVLYPIKSVIAKLVVQFTSLHVFKQIVLNHQQYLFSHLIIDMPDDKAKWFVTTCFSTVMGIVLKNSCAHQLNLSLSGIANRRHASYEPWRTRIILLNYPEIDLAYVDPDCAYGFTTLHLMTADPVNLRFVIERCKPNLNLTAGEHQSTPLMVAVERNRVESVNILLLHGADMTKKASGETVMHRAARNGHTDLFYLLLKHAGERARQLLLEPDALGISALSVELTNMQKANEAEVKACIDCLRNVIEMEEIYRAAVAVRAIKVVEYLKSCQLSKLLEAINNNRAKEVSSILRFGTPDMCEPAMKLACDLHHHKICALLAIHALKQSGLHCHQSQYGTFTFYRSRSGDSADVLTANSLLKSIQRYLSEREYKKISLLEALTTDSALMQQIESSSAVIKNIMNFISCSPDHASPIRDSFKPSAV